MNLEKLRKIIVMPSYTRYIYDPSEDVSDADYSIETQVDALREYAQNHGFTVESTFENNLEVI